MLYTAHHAVTPELYHRYCFFRMDPKVLSGKAKHVNISVGGSEHSGFRTVSEDISDQTVDHISEAESDPEVGSRHFNEHGSRNFNEDENKFYWKCKTTVRILFLAEYQNSSIMTLTFLLKRLRVILRHPIH